MPIGYDEDYFSWTQEQALFLKQGRFDLLDLEHLADEVASMGRSEWRELASRLAAVIAHLLKLQFQTERTPANERSWKRSVIEQRRALRDHLHDNPGLKNPAQMDRAVRLAWGDGLQTALRETGLEPDVFPDANPYTVDQLLADGYWP